MDIRPVSEISRLIARQLISQPGLDALLNELEASAVPIGSWRSPVPTDGIGAYRELRELRRKAEDRLKELQEENDALLLHLHYVQAELEDYLGRWKEASEKVKQRELENARVEKEKGLLESRSQSLQMEIDGSRTRWEDAGEKLEETTATLESLTDMHRRLVSLVESDASLEIEERAALTRVFDALRRVLPRREARGPSVKKTF